MQKLSNHSYKGVESLDLFKSDKDIEDYRKHCLSISQDTSNFIEQVAGKKNHVLELACGNGRLLIDLQQKGIAKESIGFDISKSRIEFANLWINQLELNEKINCSVIDIFQNPQFDEKYDVIICITSTLGLFVPIKQNADKDVLKWMKSHSKPGTHIVFEFRQYPKEIELCLMQSPQPLKIWHELSKSDPFRFYLHHIEWDKKNRILSHYKTFIHRNGSVDEGRSDKERVYTSDEISNLCKQYGFAIKGLYKNWKRDIFKNGDPNLIVHACYE